jgi:hypothetical protein
MRGIGLPGVEFFTEDEKVYRRRENHHLRRTTIAKK